MGGRQRAERLARERARRVRVADSQLALLGRVSIERQAACSRRAAARTCGWCGGAIDVKPVGRIPTWCSQTCRQRAWEQKRAAESGLVAVRVVERVVEQPTRGGFDAAALRPGDWPALLQVLAQQLERGRIYKRDLPDLTPALDDLISAYRRATR